VVDSQNEVAALPFELATASNVTKTSQFCFIVLANWVNPTWRTNALAFILTQRLTKSIKWLVLGEFGSKN
jgi:hypothetical protein